MLVKLTGKINCIAQGSRLRRDESNKRLTMFHGLCRLYLTLLLVCFIETRPVFGAIELDEEPVCNFTLSTYSTSDCQDLFLETAGTIVANNTCNKFPNTVDETSGPGPYYRALCLKRGFAMVAARCTNDACNACQDEGRYRQNYDGTGWKVDERKGTCHTMGYQGQSFFAELIPEEITFGQEEQITRSPTEVPSVSPTYSPTIASNACKWTLNHHGSSNIFNDYSCSEPAASFDIIADGFCNYHEKLMYYRAKSTSCGLVFDAAHCTRPDCSGCFEFSSGNVVFNDCLEDAQVCGFLGSKEPYLSTGCYSRLRKEDGLGGSQSYSDIWSFETNCGTFPRPDCNPSSSKARFGKQLVSFLLATLTIYAITR